MQVDKEVEMEVAHLDGDAAGDDDESQVDDSEDEFFAWQMEKKQEEEQGVQNGDDTLVASNPRSQTPP